MTEFNVDPNFSIYNLLRRRQTVDNLVSHRVTMSKISSVIEKATQEDYVNNIIFSSFQYLSKFEPQIESYRQIAQYARHVYVFGVPDKQMPVIPNLTYIPLKPTDQLVREWFIVSHGADFSTALATQELSNFHSPDHEWQFTGVLLFDEALVNILANWLYQTVGQQVDIDQLGTTINFSRRIRVIENLQQRLEQMIKSTTTETHVREELKKFHHIAHNYIQQSAQLNQSNTTF